MIAGLHDWLVFLHILAAMVWFGGLVVLSLLASLALRGGQADVARFVGSLRLIGPLVLAPAMGAVVLLGIWMVLDSDAWSFGQTWVWLALVLFGAAFVVGAAFQSRAAIEAQRAVGASRPQDATRHLRRWAWGMRLIVLLLAVTAWDMVFKPGL